MGHTGRGPVGSSDGPPLPEAWYSPAKQYVSADGRESQADTGGWLIIMEDTGSEELNKRCINKHLLSINRPDLVDSYTLCRFYPNDEENGILYSDVEDGR